VDRRAFIGTLAGGLLSAPLTAEAQIAKNPVVGVLYQGAPFGSITTSIRESVTQGLREEGYLEGRNIKLEHRYADLAGLPDGAKELVRMNVDVVMAAGTPATLAVRRATKTTPIVGFNMADPVADGLAASLARPGGNITGNTFLAPELGPKRLQLLTGVIPTITHVGVLEHPGVYGERTMRNMVAELERTAKAIRVDLEIVRASGLGDLAGAFAAMNKARIAALIVLPSPLFYFNSRRLVELATDHRLPTIYYFREAVEEGGLMCYGANIPDLSRRAGTYVARILKGAKPTDLPIEQPTKFDLVINLKTAKALGLTIPPSLLQRADQVIE
jgi:putative tryptophan/tyrosine transport system substrate-binding protein